MQLVEKPSTGTTEALKMETEDHMEKFEGLVASQTVRSGSSMKKVSDSNPPQEHTSLRINPKRLPPRTSISPDWPALLHKD